MKRELGPEKWAEIVEYYKTASAGSKMIETARNFGLTPSKKLSTALSQECGNPYLKKGRRPRKGERHNNAKVSDQQIIEMLIKYKNGDSPSCLAKKYGLHASQIRNIITGRARTDNLKVNELRRTVIFRDERRKPKAKIEKRKKTMLHHSAFNTESGKPVKE